MNNLMSFDVTVESGIISMFQRQNFKLDRVFSEFIDNSLQSFLDHRDILVKLDDGVKCKVNIIWNKDEIIIEDNCFGMNEAEFGRSLKLKATNPNASRTEQLSVYGMGLKYASVYLGNHYSICSTSYGSETRYFAEIDVPEFEKNNPKTVEAKLNSEYKYSHQTIITITKLRIKKTVDRENDLRQKLGIIYHHYISQGILSLTLNNIPIKYVRPELRPNENGGHYFENFEDSFEINGKTYNFSGWIAILNKGDQSITGLNLIQANRCIELGYRPQKLFGKGNSFQNSRIIGEIVFNGENYILSFNKDKFMRVDDGAEEAFIDKLTSNPKIVYIKKMSKELSFTDDKDKINKKTKKSFDNNKNITQVQPDTVEPSNVKGRKEPLPPELKGEVDNIENIKKTNFDNYLVKVNGNDVKLFVDIESNGAKTEWINFSKYEDGYLMKINFDNDFIRKNFNTQASKAATNALAIVLGTSILQAQDYGVKLSDSILLLKCINEIMGCDDDK